MSVNVAIIIPNYNYGEYVIDAIDSVMSQVFTEGEIRAYVVDDGSSDDSWNKIISITDPIIYKDSSSHMDAPYYKGPIERRQRQNVYVCKINNSGASTARNVAMWEAWEWANIFGLLDADDMYKSNKVNTLVAKLSEHDEIGVAYGDYDIHTILDNDQLIKYEAKFSYSRDTLLQQCIVHSGSLIKKNFLQQVILPNQEIFDSRLHGPGSKEFIGCTEDYDLWIRLSKICMMVHVPQSLSVVRTTGRNQSIKVTPDIFQKNAKILGSR